MGTYWTISIACFLRDLRPSKDLKAVIDKYCDYDCGFFVPERSQHLTLFAIAAYPKPIQEEEDALPGFEKFRAEIEKSLATHLPTKTNNSIELTLTGVKSYSDGLSLQFESEDLKTYRKNFLGMIEDPYWKLAGRYRWKNLLNHKLKSRGKFATASIIRIPLEKGEKRVFRWERKELPLTLTCKIAHLVLSNPSLTNPYEDSCFPTRQPVGGRVK